MIARSPGRGYRYVGEQGCRPGRCIRDRSHRASATVRSSKLGAFGTPSLALPTVTYERDEIGNISSSRNGLDGFSRIAELVIGRTSRIHASKVPDLVAVVRKARKWNRMIGCDACRSIQRRGPALCVLFDPRRGTVGFNSDGSRQSDTFAVFPWLASWEE